MIYYVCIYKLKNCTIAQSSKKFFAFLLNFMRKEKNF